jgi:peptide/nickel transport system substrate-binding protein
LPHFSAAGQFTLGTTRLKQASVLLFFVFLFLTACDSVVVTPASTPESAVELGGTSLATAAPLLSPSPTPVIFPRRSGANRGGKITLGLVGRPQTLNPLLENNQALRELTPLLYDTLLQADPETASLGPGLAQSWEFSAGGRQVTFHLPPNLKWSDGSPLTAAAIAESLQATRHPALGSFSQISAADDRTLTLSFAGVDCGALNTLALLPLVPGDQILDPVPSGSGPFRALDWAPNQRTLVLTRNPHFHGQAPFLDDITVRFVSEDEADIALSEGQFDAFGPLENRLPAEIPDHLKDLSYPSPQVTFIAINFEPRNGAPLHPQVRRALVLALDREAMLAEVLAGDGQLMAASLLPDHWAANKTISPPDYDPATAGRLLARAGLADTDSDGWLDREGQRLELGIRLNGNNPLHQRLGWLASSYYRDLGLFARAESVPPDSIIDDLFTHDFELAIFSWLLQPDPDQRPYWLAEESTEGLGLNFTSYANPELDDFLASGVTVAGCHPNSRNDYYSQAQEILSQDRPVDFLLTPHRHLLRSNRLQGLRPGPFAPLTWNVTDWYLQE